MSEQLYRIRAYMLKKKREQAGAAKPLLQRRAEADGAMIASIRLPEGTAVEEAKLAGVSGLWVRAPGVPENAKVLLYYHGGGFFSGSPQTHQGLAAELSAASGLRVLLPAYRLTPEHPYPAAHEDAFSAYKALLNSGIPGSGVALAGDSAGGMLALMTALSARDSGLPRPAALALLSPWLDIEGSDMEGCLSRDSIDPMVDAADTLREAERYFGSLEFRESIAPLRKNMAGLPPTLIQVGDQEVLLSDSRRLAENMKEAGVDVTLQVWPELWHVFQALTAILPEANDAVKKIGEFLKSNMF